MVEALNAVRAQEKKVEGMRESVAIKKRVKKGPDDPWKHLPTTGMLGRAAKCLLAPSWRFPLAIRWPL